MAGGGVGGASDHFELVQEGFSASSHFPHDCDFHSTFQLSLCGDPDLSLQYVIDLPSAPLTDANNVLKNRKVPAGLINL